MHGLILIPWHIGDRRDLTFGAVRELRRLRCFLTEDPGQAAREFAALLPKGTPAKRLLALPERPSSRLVDDVLAILRDEDVGVAASGGAPCFVDPGAWLVRELRGRGVAITALAGASCLSTVLSLSGLESTGRPELAGVFFFARKYSAGRETFAQAFRRQQPDRPAVVLLRKADFGACVRALLPAAGGRDVSVFFDLTKPKSAYPYAGQVLTRPCSEWPARTGEIDWDRVSEISLVVHPR